MSFFKVDKDLTDTKVPDPYKLRYVIDNDGTGYWVEPIKPLPTDYDEDIDY